MKREVRFKDLFNAPTAITAASLIGVLEGAEHIDTRRGKILIALGRVGDVVDGYMARLLGQSSDAGAIVDVVADKAGMWAIGKAMWQHDTAPKPVLAGMAIKHSISAAATLYHGLGDSEERAIRPPKSGKLSMAADNISLISFALADELNPDSHGYRVARGLGWVAAAGGLILGADSINRYIHNEFDESPAPTTMLD